MALLSFTFDLKNEESCVTGMANRLPDYQQTLKYSSKDKSFVLEEVNHVKGIFTVAGVDYPYEVKDITKDVVYPSIAFDLLNGYVVTYMQEGRGFIYFYDTLNNKFKLQEIGCTSSYACTAPLKVFKNSTPEVYVVLTTNNGEVAVLNQSSRFSEKVVVGQVQPSALVRVAGITLSNRFLIRFFDKIKLV